MKVALAVYGGLAGRSGGYLYDRMLARHLEQCGDEIEVIDVPGRCDGIGLLSNADPRLLRRLERLDADVLVEDELCHPSLCLLNRRLKRCAPFPIVGVIHHLACEAEEDHGRARRHEIVERRYLGSLDGVVANSQATLRSVRRHVPQIPGVVARPGRDHVHARSVDRDMSGPLTMLYVGNILPHKKLETLVLAMARLPPGRARLDVVGAAPDPLYLRRVVSTVRTHGLDSNITFHGRADDAERDRLMDQAHVLVLPSRHEGYGLVLVEALACGLPVIAPSSGGAGEVVSHGQEGFLVEADDIETLASYLSMLDQDRDLLGELSSRAARRFEALPTWGEEMGRAREFLLSLLH